MIRVQNIYYMLAYAFQVLREEGYSRIATEDFESAGDLFACILAKGIAGQLKRGLAKDYNEITEARSSPVGRIQITDSIRCQTQLRHQLVCSFDEFSENTYLNRILKTTATILYRDSSVKKDNRMALKKCLLYLETVDVLNPYKIEWAGIRYHRNNAAYQMLINICYLVIEGLIQTEQRGEKKLATYLDDQRMSALYERFLLNYYRRHHPELCAAASHIAWQLDEKDDATIRFLPTMRSDITLTHNGKTLIIDAKYYARAMQTHSMYNSKTIHSNNLYQIFTYVKNKDIGTGDVSGLLLYAKTDEEIAPDCEFVMSGNRIGVKTLDLDCEFSAIEKQLDDIKNAWLDCERSIL